MQNLIEPGEYDWSGASCMGYAILALESLGYNHIEIDKIIRAMRYEFDMKTLHEAANHYNRSPY